ncbi:MAG: M48 family metallopeptidase [Bradyrhizobiaceae bacterium]|nr:M48 family metallopeptidase [Bradyrhizobiaceae bacterium]
MQLPLPLFLRRKPEPEERRLVVSCANEAFEITLKRHPRARRYTLRVLERSREVVMTIPPRGSLRQAREFAEKNAGWIAARVKRIPQPIPILAGAVIPVRGVMHRVAHRPKARGTVWFEADADGAPLLCVTGQAQHVPRRVRDFLKREAKRDLTLASRRHASALGVAIERIGIRDTTSRWGSCSRDAGHMHSLSYSWRLVLAPAFVLDYLAAHEVAHCRELNHSARFWRLVDALTPDRRRAEAWLKAHGNELHRYGATL